MILVRALIVAAGGALGVALRMLLGMAIPDAGGVPVSVLTANVIGSFLIGVLTARLPATKRRLFLGTGVLGGFTTYSAFTVGAVGLWASSPLLAAGYALGSLVLGIAAAAVGLHLFRREQGSVR
ncbi:CrcB family protein [Microbacterium sp. KUDC0406]|uniref:fluoride efflux transporter FluC n=1 Tax=Microbacterium sp. KUDC0406 TaxID=2909588 RepID=UPI001F25C75D|nr:CrcB family protein [Microbacterium sp. KUDC0406]UJP09204.1 CrcB family protein [Microbacterium sp. KUDC0406]